MQKVQNTAAHLILRAPRHPNCNLIYSNSTGSKLQSESNTKLFVCVTMQSQALPSLVFLNYWTLILHFFKFSAFFIRHRHAQPQNHGFRTFLHFSLHIWKNFPQNTRHSANLSPLKGKTFFFSPNISVKQLSFTRISLYNVCVCARVRACMCAFGCLGTRVCMHLWECVHISQPWWTWCICVCVHLCACVCVYVHVRVFMHMHVCMHVWVHA